VQVVGESPFVAVEFFAPWCGHCKRLEPEWRSAAEAFASDPPPGLTTEIKLAAVDATEEGALATKYGVRGYPTIKIFRNGDLESPQDYNGPRDAEGIIGYLASMAGPASVPLATAADVTKMVEDSSLVVITVGADATAAVDALAEQRRGGPVAFANVEAASALPASVDAAGASVVMVRKFAPTVVTFSGDASDAAAVAAFVDDNSVPPLVMLSSDKLYEAALQSIFSSQDPKVIVFSDDWSDAVQAAVIEATAAMKGRADVIGADSEEGKRAAGFFGVDDSPFPVMAAHSPRTDSKYLGEAGAEITAAGIIEFATGVAEGTIAPHIKSEPVPESNDGPVKVVVADEFDAIVMSGKDVLIEFYAPWCGHCQKLAPTYEDVGKWAADNAPNVTVAKMDATANDVVNKEFDVRGFPTIYFVKGATGEVMSYDGERTLDGFKDFLLEHASDHAEL